MNVQPGVLTRQESACRGLVRPGNPGRQCVAKIGDEVVGTPDAGLGQAGINLFGGSVAEHARGRGAYRVYVDQVDGDGG